MHAKDNLLAGNIQEYASAWLKSRGEIFCAATRVYGGRNNRSWRIDTRTGSYFLKEYFRHPDDRRNRLNAEFLFLEFCKKCSIGNVPSPLLRNDAAGFAIYDYIPGEPVKNDAGLNDIGIDAIQYAASFINKLAINSECESASSLPFAADACKTMEDHFLLADRKVKNLLNVLGNTETKGLIGKAANFLNNRLFPAWQNIENTAREKILNAKFDANEKKFIVSPSDFGFHNALKTTDSIFFVDFEYAGLDDPLKMICDFFCQPQVPVSEKYISVLVSPLEAFARENILALTSILLPVHRIKWCCIILNDFLRTPALRRNFSGSVNIESRLARQLDKAIKYADLFLDKT